MLRFFFICLFSCTLISCTTFLDPVRVDKKLSIIPEPVSIVTKPGHFSVNQSTVLYCSQPDLFPVAAYLNEKLQPALGFELAVKEGEGKGINLQILKNKDEHLGEEGYRLVVTPRKILITANKPQGIFYGIQTLRQMMPPQVKSNTQQDLDWKIGCAEIEDMPRFPWRGLMLDVSRHFFSKEEVKDYIDQLAEYKMNVFHLHLTDDQGWRIQIKSLPKLTEIGAWRVKRVGQWLKRTPRMENEPTEYGGFYSHEDIKEIVQYAKERFVDIVPEIEMPGHSMAAIAAYPEISCTQTVKDVNVGNDFYTKEENSLCVGNDLTFEYLDKIFSEVALLFPFEYVHVGGDECYKGFWSKCPKCIKRIKDETLKDTHELQSYFIKRVEKILESKNKRLIGWDEILEGGLAPNATVMSWRGMSGGIKAAKEGHEVIMTPTTHCYLDLYQGEKSVEPDTYSMLRLSDSYNFEPVPEGVNPELILGGQGNLWTESVPNFRHAQYMTWPRGWALAEVLWSPGESKNWNHFIRKVEAHFIRADYGQIKYATSMYNAIITPFLNEDSIMQIQLETEVNGLDIYYTFDNTDPDTYSPEYNHLLSIPKDATWLKVATYKDDKPVGEMITLRIDELEGRIQ